MSTLAQLHDCHSCNDERSIVQKKSMMVNFSNHEEPSGTPAPLTAWFSRPSGDADFGVSILKTKLAK